MKLNVKKLQQGNALYKPNQFSNIKLDINKKSEVSNLTPINQLSNTSQFNKSKFNFLNLQKQKPLLNFMSMGNIGYDSNTVLKLIDDFEGFSMNISFGFLKA